jgi:hypothetical protein
VGRPALRRCSPLSECLAKEEQVSFILEDAHAPVSSENLMHVKGNISFPINKAIPCLVVKNIVSHASSPILPFLSALSAISRYISCCCFLQPALSFSLSISSPPHNPLLPSLSRASRDILPYLLHAYMTCVIASVSKSTTSFKRRALRSRNLPSTTHLLRSPRTPLHYFQISRTTKIPS